MKLIAHRGGAKQHPENTLKAFTHAANNNNIDMIELDVRQTQTGEIIVIHDYNLHHLTNTNTTTNTPLTQLTPLTINNTNQHIPTLHETLQTIPPTTPLNIEIKEPNIAQQVHTITTQYEHDVIFSSFLHEPLQTLNKHDHQTAYLFITGWKTNLKHALNNNYNALHPIANLVTQPRIKTAHKHDLTVNAWTINNPETYHYFKNNTNLDGVITDDLTLPTK